MIANSATDDDDDDDRKVIMHHPILQETNGHPSSTTGGTFSPSSHPPPQPHPTGSHQKRKTSKGMSQHPNKDYYMLCSPWSGTMKPVNHGNNHEWEATTKSLDKNHRPSSYWSEVNIKDDSSDGLHSSQQPLFTSAILGPAVPTALPVLQHTFEMQHLLQRVLVTLTPQLQSSSLWPQHALDVMMSPECPMFTPLSSSSQATWNGSNSNSRLGNNQQHHTDEWKHRNFLLQDLQGTHLQPLRDVPTKTNSTVAATNTTTTTTTTTTPLTASPAAAESRTPCRSRLLSDKTATSSDATAAAAAAARHHSDCYIQRPVPLEVQRISPTSKKAKETPIVSAITIVPCRSRGMPEDHNFKVGPLMMPAPTTTTNKVMGEHKISVCLLSIALCLCILLPFLSLTHSHTCTHNHAKLFQFFSLISVCLFCHSTWCSTWG